MAADGSVIIEIQGDNSQFRTALEKTKKETKDLEKELQEIDDALKLNPDSVELLAQKQEVLRKIIEKTEQAVRDFKTTQDAVDSGQIEANAENYRLLEREIANAEASLAEYQEAASKASASTQELIDSFKNTGAQLSSVGDKMTASLTVPLTAGATAAVKYASDLEESLNKVDVAFGSSAGSVRQWSETTLTSIGLAQGTALDAAALFGDMATSMGSSQAEAAEMSKSIVDLAGDLASFKNVGIDEAMTALKGIFTGETESLKNLGVVMTEANLEAYALAEGIEKSVSAMTQAEKVQLRYSYVMSQTTNAQGDFARTSDSTANQLRILQESLKQAAATIGGDLLPIITPLLENISGLVQRFSELDESTRKNIVQTGLFLAALGPALKITGGLNTAVSTAISLYQSLKTAHTAATASQVALNTAMNANPVGLVITAISGLIAVLGALAVSQAVASDGAEEAADKYRGFADAVKENQDAYAEAAAEVEEQANSVSSLIASLDELLGKGEKTAADQAVILRLVEELNAAVPDLALSYDEQTGALTRLGGAAEVSAESLRGMAAEQAKREQYDAALERATQLETERTTATQELEAARQRLANVEAQHQAILDQYGGSAARAGMALVDTGTEITHLHESIASYETTLASLDEEYRQLEPIVDELGTEIKEQEEAQRAATAANEAAKQSLDDVIADMQSLTDAYNEAYDAAYQSIDSQIGLFEVMPETVGSSVDGMISALDSQIAYMDNYSANLAAAAEMGVDEGLLAKLSDGSTESAEILQGIVDGGGEKVAELNEKFGQVEEGKKAFSDQVAEMQTDFDVKMAELERRLLEAVGGMNQSAEMQESAKDTIDGYVRGIESNSDRLVSAMRNLGLLGKRAFDDSIGRASPAKEFIKSGKDSVEGYVIGVESQQDKMADAMEEAGELIIEAFPDEEMQAQAEELLDHYGEFWDEYVSDTQAAADELQSVLDDIENRWDEVARNQEAMAGKLADYGELMGSKIIGVTSEGKAIETPVLADLGKQIDEITRYGEAMDALKSRGVSESLMSEILGMGMEDALTYSDLLLQQSDEDWAAYMSQWEEKQALAQQISEDFYAGEFAALETEFSDKLTTGMAELEEISYEAGIQTMEGLLNGLREKKDEIRKEAESIASLIQNTFSTAMNTGSPSKWMRDHIGKMIPAGIAVGLEDGAGEAVEQARRTSEAIQNAVMGRLREAVQNEAARFSANLAVSSNAKEEARTAARSSQTAALVGGVSTGMMAGTGGDVVLSMDGIEFGRVFLPSLRAVEDQSPRIVSDTL